MYLGNSVKIGVLDKGGKWRKKDWFLRKMELSTDERLKEEQEAARKMDQDRINAALGITEPEDEEKLTEAEMQELMKKIKAKKDGIEEKNETAVGLGFDKLKV